MSEKIKDTLDRILVEMGYIKNKKGYYIKTVQHTVTPQMFKDMLYMKYKEIKNKAMGIFII